MIRVKSVLNPIRGGRAKMGKKIVVLGGVGKMCSSTVIDLSKIQLSEIVLPTGYEA
jgi:hypothetical protein